MCDSRLRRELCALVFILAGVGITMVPSNQVTAILAAASQRGEHAEQRERGKRR